MKVNIFRVPEPEIEAMRLKSSWQVRWKTLRLSNKRAGQERSTSQRTRLPRE